MLLNTYYYFWNQRNTIQIKIQLKLCSHMMMVKSANYILVTTLSPCNSKFSNQTCSSLWMSSKRTSRWTTFVKTTMPNSLWITFYMNAKLRLFIKCNNLTLSKIAFLWFLKFHHHTCLSLVFCNSTKPNILKFWILLSSTKFGKIWQIANRHKFQHYSK